ncbi:MAG: WD40/YVTN/BNR-like repeat-containing protein [Kofleriaceae bacterium]
MRWLVALLLLPGIALAQGRSPLTNGIYLRPGDDHSLYVRATFGLLISHDDGCSFRWVCERAIGYSGAFDPKYAVASDGTIFASTFTGLRISRDGGCNWTTATAGAASGAPGNIATMWIDAIDLSPSGDVWVATADSGKPNNVYRSTDNGATFEPRGLSSPVIWWKSVKVARSNAQRIYAAGYQVATQAKAHLMRSDNAGRAWTELPLAGLRYGATPIIYVSGVDPEDPDLVFVSSLGAQPPNGDRLYRSSDGGGSFVEVLATTDPIRDVVFGAGKVIAATLAGGSFQSSDRGETFTRIGSGDPSAPDATPPQLGCLARRRDGVLIGCGANWQPDFMAVARSSDAATWTKVFRFADLAGPVDCPAGSAVHDQCGALWPTLQRQLGASGTTRCAPPPAAPSSQPTLKHSGGCCDASGGPSDGPLALSAAAVLLISRRRRVHRASADRQLG